MMIYIYAGVGVLVVVAIVLVFVLRSGKSESSSKHDCKADSAVGIASEPSKADIIEGMTAKFDCRQKHLVYSSKTQYMTHPDEALLSFVCEDVENLGRYVDFICGMHFSAGSLELMTNSPSPNTYHLKCPGISGSQNPERIITDETILALLALAETKQDAMLRKRIAALYCLESKGKVSVGSYKALLKLILKSTP